MIHMLDHCLPSQFSVVLLQSIKNGSVVNIALLSQTGDSLIDGSNSPALTGEYWSGMGLNKWDFEQLL